LLIHMAETGENLVNPVKQGKDLVMSRFASEAFEDWPDSANLADKMQNRKASHDPHRLFTVKIVQP
jgi:hypothetical protein